MIDEFEGFHAKRTTNFLFFTISGTKREVVHIKLVGGPQHFISDRTKAVDLFWFADACFWCKSFCDSLYLYYSSSFSVARWPTFGK